MPAQFEVSQPSAKLMIAKLLHSMHCRLLSSYTLPPKFVVLFSLVAVSSAGNPINKTQTVSACDSGDISS